MGAIKEKWEYGDNRRVWVGKYLNSSNELHWHDDCELIYIEQGEMHVFFDGNTYTLKRGNAMFLDSRRLHRIATADETTLLQVVVFDRRIIAEFASELTLANPVIEDGSKVSEAYSAILNEFRQKHPMYKSMTESLVHRLMVDIFREHETTEKKPLGVTSETLKKLIAEIKANYEWYTLSDAANFMGMNENYFSQYFYKKTNSHFTHFINCVRVEKAVELLAKHEHTMAEIAVRCGFGTIRSFNNVFRKITGYTPSKLPANYVFAVPTDDGDTDIKPMLVDVNLIESSS